MSAATIQPTSHSNNAGLSSPHPAETHQRANVNPHQRPGVKGQKRSVVMNGSRLDLEHDGQQWWIVKVSAP